MAPHATETNGAETSVTATDTKATNGTESPITAIDTNGNETPVNAGETPHEPGIRKRMYQARAINFPRPPKFEDKYAERDHMKGALAAAFRIFGKYGFDEGVAGHITLRDPVQPDCFWVNPFGMSFSMISRSDLIVSTRGMSVSWLGC